jgi:hypothetical protein
VVKKILQQLFGILILFGFLAGVLAIVFVPVEMAKMTAVREWPSWQRSGASSRVRCYFVLSKRRVAGHLFS